MALLKKYIKNSNFFFKSSNVLVISKFFTSSKKFTEIYDDPNEAIKDIKSGANILVGGFGIILNHYELKFWA